MFIVSCYRRHKAYNVEPYRGQVQGVIAGVRA